jgi:DNA-binding MurR/RpiR family transcriptional regulator
MSQERILAKLSAKEIWRTQSERVLARYFGAHVDDLAFETAASIAKHVGVSGITVGRFLRRLGYRRLGELARDLRGGPPNSAWQVKVAGSSGHTSAKTRARQLRAHVDNLTRVYDLATTSDWRRATQLLAGAAEVFVAAFQNEQGIGQYFASQLGYARTHVRFLGGADGTFQELLSGPSSGKCLVIIDSRRYARCSGLLARRANETGIKVVAITDIYCPWAGIADISLNDPGEEEIFWDSSVSTVALLELLLEDVIEALGKRVTQRIEQLSDLQDFFGEFSDA